MLKLTNYQNHQNQDVQPNQLSYNQTINQIILLDLVDLNKLKTTQTK
jgi:hypothetical protein